MQNHAHRTTDLNGRARTAASPSVTVVTAVFNGSEHLQRCIDSVASQDYADVEHLVMDGGSTDGTVELLEKNQGSVVWRSEPDLGVYDAWNKALRVARGEWICFLGSDDEFLPGAISTYMELARTTPGAEYLCSRERWVHASGYERVRGGPWTWHKFSRWNCVAHVGSMHHRDLFRRLGTYDLSFGTASDYELLLRAGPTLKAAFVPAITVLMRGGGMTDRRKALADATRAKIATGGRNPQLAALELYFAYAKYPLRPIRTLMRHFGRSGG